MLDPAVTARDSAALLPVYSRIPIEVVHAEGMYLHDREGNAHLDLVGGLAVNVLGHRHPEVVDAQVRQLGRFSHVSNTFLQEPQITLAERLKELTGCAGVFFCNSGAETSEAAIKLVRRWGSDRRKTGLVAFTGGFHGRTYGPLSLMTQQKYREGFGPFLDGCRVLPFNDVDALEQGIDASTAAVMLECVQGEAGVLPIDDAFARKLLELRSQHGFLIVADEIQAGLGRTGRFTSAEHWNLEPDIIQLAKGIGGGLPLGALLVRDHLTTVLAPGSHGTTFGGNAVSCAGGLATLDVIIRQGLMDRTAAIGRRFLQRGLELQARFPDVIREVRGMGCMIGIDLSKHARTVFRGMLERHVIVNVTHDHIIRLLPPYIITDAEIDHAMSMLAAVLEDQA